MPAAEPAPARGFWPMRDLPTAIWLVFTAIAAASANVLPVPRWLLIHLLLLGAVTHAILVWSQYFSFALLRSRATVTERRNQNLRLVLANAGATLVLIGVPVRVWTITLVGSSALVVAVAWHGYSIALRARHAMPGMFGRTIRYYIASAALLVVGVVLGALIAGGGAPELVFAHAIINVLGWIGLTVAGTVVTLWPTILRTRAAEQAPSGAARALPCMASGVLGAAVGAALGWLPLIALGLLAYLAGLVIIGVSLWRAARQSPPKDFAALSVGCALLWWVGSITALIIGVGVAAADGSGYPSVARLIRQVVPFFAAGFAVQVLIGALSYLIPVVLGGGPRPVKAGTAAFNRWGRVRAAVTNAGLIVCALPAPPVVHQCAAVLAGVALASFLVIMTFAMRAQRLAKAANVERPPQAGRPLT